MSKCLVFLDSCYLTSPPPRTCFIYSMCKPLCIIHFCSSISPEFQGSIFICIYSSSFLPSSLLWKYFLLFNVQFYMTLNSFYWFLSFLPKSNLTHLFFWTSLICNNYEYVISVLIKMHGYFSWFYISSAIGTVLRSWRLYSIF